MNKKNKQIDNDELNFSNFKEKSSDTNFEEFNEEFIECIDEDLDNSCDECLDSDESTPDEEDYIEYDDSDNSYEDLEYEDLEYEDDEESDEIDEACYIDCDDLESEEDDTCSNKCTHSCNGCEFNCDSCEFDIDSCEFDLENCEFDLENCEFDKEFTERNSFCDKSYEEHIRESLDKLNQYIDRQKRIYDNKLSHGFNVVDFHKEARFILKELSELMSAIEHNDIKNIMEELADIVIFCYGMAEMAHGDLDKHIFSKMNINESREYIKDMNGDFIRIE